MNWNDFPPEVLMQIIPWYKLKWYVEIPRSVVTTFTFTTPESLACWLAQKDENIIVPLEIKFIPEPPYSGLSYSRAVFDKGFAIEGDIQEPHEIITETYPLEMFGLSLALVFKANDKDISYMNGLFRERYRSWVMVENTRNDFIYNIDKIFQEFESIMPKIMIPYFKELFYKEMGEIKGIFSILYEKDYAIKTEVKDLRYM